MFGGVLGAGITGAGLGLVDGETMAAIVASWIVSPVFGAGLAALMLYFIKTKILYAEDRLAAANKWVPVLIALMAGAFMAYMSLKGLRQIWRPSMPEIAFFSGQIGRAHV